MQERSYAGRIWMLLGFSFLLLLRRSAQLLHPQVWAEDGTEIIPGFLNHGIASFAFPVNGYLVTVPKLIMGMSLGISSLYLPLISTLLTWLFIVGVCLAIAISPTWLNGRLLLCLAALMAPSDPEVFGIPLYSFWWASMLLFLVVLWDERSSDIKWRVIFVLLGGLSSPVIFLVTPLLALRTLIFKPRLRGAVVLSTAVFCCLIQGLAAHNRIGHTALGAANLRLVLPKFLGSYLAGNLPHTTDKLLWFSAGIVVSFLVATIPFLMERPRYLFLLSLWIGTMLLSAARINLSIIHPRFAAPRYFFFPYVLLSWYLVSVLTEGNRSGLRRAAGALLFISVLNAFFVLSRSHHDLSWTQHVVSCNRFDRYAIPISIYGDEPWLLDLDRDRCELLQHAGLIDSQRRLIEAKSYPYRMEAIDSKALQSEGLSEARLASVSAVIEDRWKGTDYPTSNLPGFKVIGSVLRGDAETGTLTLQLRRGEKILFRSGPDVTKQAVSIQDGGRFLQRLPPIPRWIILDFSNNALPDEFRASFRDMGESPGEWSAIALRQ